MYKVLLLSLFLWIPQNYLAQEELFAPKDFVENGDSLRYRVLMPKNFDEGKKYPMLIFLHGAGERGNDNKKQLSHGANLFAKEIMRDSFPAIIVFPQCPEDSYWSNVVIDRTIRPLGLDFPKDKDMTRSLKLVSSLIKNWMEEEYIDKSRIYLGGLSMGGMGTFEMLHRFPDLFAAAFAICGAGDPGSTKTYADRVPIWIFHGAKDDVVNPIHSLEMTQAILTNGGFPRLTLYDDANHNSWDNAFKDADLLPWLFDKHKN